MDKKFPPWKLTRAHQSVFLSHIWSKRQLDMVWFSETELVKLTLPILQSFWKSLWHPPPLFGQSPVFPESFFLNSKVRFDENLKKSRLQDSFCVNFKSVLCQTCIFFYIGLTLPPPHLILLKNARLVRRGIPKNDDATKVRSVEDISPRKTFVWQHGCSNLSHKLDKAPRLSIRRVIWILASDTVFVQLNL